jgi:hypothetical protein
MYWFVYLEQAQVGELVRWFWKCRVSFPASQQAADIATTVFSGLSISSYIRLVGPTYWRQPTHVYLKIPNFMLLLFLGWGETESTW